MLYGRAFAPWWDVVAGVRQVSAAPNGVAMGVEQHQLLAGLRQAPAFAGIGEPVAQLAAAMNMLFATPAEGRPHLVLHSTNGGHREMRMQQS